MVAVIMSTVAALVLRFWSWQRLMYTASMCGTNPITSATNAASAATSATMNAILPGTYMPMPNPPPPGVTLTSNPNAPGAIPAGADSGGNEVYAVPQTAQDDMAAFKKVIDQYMIDQGNATPPDTSCSSWASIFDPNCNSWGTVLAIGGAVVGALLLVNLTGGRR